MNLLSRSIGTVDDPSSIGSSIVDLEEGKAGIRKILEAHFQTLYGYSNLNVLWAAAQNELTTFLNDNAISTTADLWDFVHSVFGQEFTLSYPHIWKTEPNYPLNVRGIAINLARQCDGMITRKQIDDYFSRIKIGTPTNYVLVSQGELLFCYKAVLVPADDLNLSIERCELVSNALKGLFSEENAPYIILRDIKGDWYRHLPELAVAASWTPMLLQEVLRIRPSIGYRVILPNLKGQAFDTLGTAIVPNHSNIHTFADVVHRHCYAKHNLPHSISAEDLRLELREAGMLEGNELIWNMHKALKDYRFAFDNEKVNIKILEH